MAIPKVIHYCWFGGNEKPPIIKKCIKSWRKYCPDYEIVEWNESNFDVHCIPYCEQAYNAKKWAFVSDYARLKVIYDHGGIYLDTDVEVIRALDPLLKHDCFIGRQPGFQVNTGAGFGASAQHPVIKRMLDDYEGVPFIKENGEMDLWTCPHRNSQWLFANGLRSDDSYQEISGVTVYPIEFFSPKDAYSRETKVTKNTYSIHHCDGSWSPKETRFTHAKRYVVCLLMREFDRFIHLPNLLLRKLLGVERYERIKRRLKGE